MNTLLIFTFKNKLHFSRLLLLDAFLKQSGDLYKQSGVQIEAWAVLDGCECLHSSVVLNLKWQEVWLLDSCTVDGLEGKELV